MKGSSVTRAQIEQCKGSHRHQFFITDVERPSMFGNPVWEMCEICTTVRVSIIDRRGDLASRRYIHPDNYKSTTITTQQYRLNLIKSFRKSQREMRSNVNAQ